MKVEITAEAIDKVVKAELKYCIKYHTEALEDARGNGGFQGIYSWDREEEIKELKKQLKALKRVLSLYE